MQDSLQHYIRCNYTWPGRDKEPIRFQLACQPETNCVLALTEVFYLHNSNPKAKQPWICLPGAQRQTRTRDRLLQDDFTHRTQPVKPLQGPCGGNNTTPGVITHRTRRHAGTERRCLLESIVDCCYVVIISLLFALHLTGQDRTGQACTQLLFFLTSVESTTTTTTMPSPVS